MDRIKGSELSTDSRKSAFLLLWHRREDGRPAHGSFREVALRSDGDKSTITRLWRAVSKKIDDHVNNEDGEPVEVEKLVTDIRLYENNRKQRGSKKKWDASGLKEVV